MKSIETDAPVDTQFYQMLGEYAKTAPCHVLYLEDDRRAASNVKQLFEGEPVTFFHAGSAEEASAILQEYPIDFVVVDIRLGEGGMSGESWIVENEEVLRECTVVVLTGQISAIQDYKNLERIVSLIVRKGDPEQRQLWRKPAKMALRRAAEVFGREASALLGSSGYVSPRGRSDAAVVIGEAAVGLFKKWVGKFKPDEIGLFVGGTELTMSDLLGEVEEGTVRGQRLLRVFLEEMEDYL